MRKILIPVCALFMLILLTGCGNDTAEAAEESMDPKQEVYEEEVPLEPKAGGVDVDLSVLSGTVCYAEVYNMTVAPQDYAGKTVKMKGDYTTFTDESGEKIYHACVVRDATACCAQGIEFDLSDDYSYPEDYPENGEEICVSGVFDTYLEDGNMYITLRDAVMLPIS